MVKKILVLVVIVLSTNLYGYEYSVEPCDDGSFWNIMNGIDPWVGGDFGLTNYTSQGTGAVWLTVNTEGDWSNGVLRRFGPLRFQGGYATSMADIKSIKFDIYNPSGTNMIFRLYVITKWDTSKWQYSTEQTALANQWTTLEFDLTQDNWNPRGIGDWPDAGSWDQYLHGRENIEEIRLEVFKNDGNNSLFSNQRFILDNIKFTVDDSVIMDFESYEDKTMNNGSKRTVPTGSSVTDYIINNSYQGTQALRIEYNVAANTNAIVWLPQLCRNFTNIRKLSFVTKGTGVLQLLFSESIAPPFGIAGNSDGDVWQTKVLRFTNNEWDTFYISMDSLTKYSGSGAGVKDLSYITNIGIKLLSGTGGFIIDNLKTHNTNYFGNSIVDIFPAPGSLFTNSYSKCKIYFDTGLDKNNFKININGTEFDKDSVSLKIDTNANFILINNLDDFNKYEILKFRITDDNGLDYSWVYYKKSADVYESSTIDDFEKYSSDSDIKGVWSTGNSSGSTVSVSLGDISYTGNNSMQINYSIESNGWINIGRDVPMIDMSDYQYIEFFARGYGNILIGIQEDLSGSADLDGEVWASSSYPLSSGWQKYVIPIDSLTVTGGSMKGGVFDKSKIRWIEFDFNQSTLGTNKTAYIDNIKLVKTEKEFKLLSYLVPTTNEIFLLFNYKLNETADTLRTKIYSKDSSLSFKNFEIQDNSGSSTGGVRIKLNNKLANNKVYELYLDNITDINGRKFSGKIYILNLIALYKSGDSIPTAGGTVEYNDLYVVVDKNSFSTPAVISVSKISASGKNYEPIGDAYNVSFSGTPEKKLKLIIPYFKIKNIENQKKFKIAYFDGVNWIPLKSEVNEYGKYVIAEIDNAGIYSIVEYNPSDAGGSILSYNTVRVYPDIFSPNGDGINESIRFSYYLNKNSYVTIKIFTQTGELVKEVVKSCYQESGFHSDVQWNGDTDGIKLKRGIYFYKIEAVSADNSNVKDNIVKSIIIFR